jgi:glucokinase
MHSTVKIVSCLEERGALLRPRVTGGRALGERSDVDAARGGTGSLVLAIDFGGTKIAACTCTPDGRWLDDGRVVTTPSLGAAANFDRGIALARRLVGDAPLLAVGACTFGIPDEGGVALSPAIAGWDRLPLRRKLEASLEAPAVVATDVKVAAAAEARHGALAGSDPAIYLNLGTGLATAILVGGTVLQGSHGAAGEIGYALPRRPGTTNGDRKRVDGHAGERHDVRVLEDLVSGMGLARALADPQDGDRGGDAGAGRIAGDAELVANLFATAGLGADPHADRVLDDFLEELGFHLVNLAIAIDPQRIAVGGGMARAWDRIRTPLRRALEAHVPFPPELVLGAYPFDASLRGALDLGLDLAAHAAAS